MNARFWEKARRDPRGLAYWVFVLAVVAAAAVFLLTSRTSRHEATRVETTATAGRVETATAAAEALTPEAGD